jgi:hypothetical protein
MHDPGGSLLLVSFLGVYVDPIYTILGIKLVPPELNYMAINHSIYVLMCVLNFILFSVLFYGLHFLSFLQVTRAFAHSARFASKYFIRKHFYKQNLFLILH